MEGQLSLHEIQFIIGMAVERVRMEILVELHLLISDVRLLPLFLRSLPCQSTVIVNRWILFYNFLETYSRHMLV
jgi:hypothetical protein